VASAFQIPAIHGTEPDTKTEFGRMSFRAEPDTKTEFGRKYCRTEPTVEEFCRQIQSRIWERPSGIEKNKTKKKRNNTKKK
jgi:hypothetical protein